MPFPEKDARRDVLDYVRRLIDYGKGHLDPELESLTLGEVTDRIIACVISPGEGDRNG